MTYPVITDLAGQGLPVRLAWRVLGVSPAGYYDWRRRPPSTRATADAALTVTIGEIHTASRGTYGAPRVHAELRLGLGLRCGRNRVERLMRAAGLAGVHRRRLRHGQHGRPAPASHDDSQDLVQRRFTADARDRLWVTDITQHRTGEGWVYAAVVLDVFSRWVVGWSIADHLRTELVVDAPDMARWRRRPTPASTVVHSDRGSQGGFNWSSQHPDGGSVRWVFVSGSWRFGQGRSPGRPTIAWRADRVRFWAAIASGVKTEDACAEVGVSAPVGFRWFRHAGGVNPRLALVVSGRYLSFLEGEEIALLRARGAGVR